ncbi:MAG: type II toxin-antitoxin system HicA family toxin [Bryobacteraceae bacterium]
MRPVDWKELVKLCEAEGCFRDRERGDHYIMTKTGLSRPVVIPKKDGLKEDVVLSVGRTLGLNRKQLEERLNPKKRGKTRARKA